MTVKKLFGIEIENISKTQILEKIKKDIQKLPSFYHIVSLNPEIFVISQKNQLFKEIVTKGQIRIIDGVGVVIAGYLLNKIFYSRLTGVELMKDLLDYAGLNSLRVMLIGAESNLANQIADCYNRKYSSVNFKGFRGINDIKNPSKEEEDQIFSIVSAFKPQFIFVAFGSPYQEIWLWRHQAQFAGVVCMGVGGAFDYLGSIIPRAPWFIQKIGMEWFFRLLVQPWRIKRQLRLIEFAYSVLKEKFKKH